MKLLLKDHVVNYLQRNPEKKFTAKEISNWIFRMYPDWCWDKLKRSQAQKHPINSENKLIQQIAAEIRSTRKRLMKSYPKIRTTDSSPMQFYWTENTTSSEYGNDRIVQTSPIQPIGVLTPNPLPRPTPKPDPQPNPPNPTPVINENDLYPILLKFLKVELSIYSKRINEERSKNSRSGGANRWRHPDLVGMENISKDWDREIKDCVQQYSDKKSKLWSFKVKTPINLSNVRESYFQAVSNSSWANYGYLVGSNSVNQETMKELRMLSSLHGIGYIQLDVNNYNDSQIVIPARERTDIDWNIANRITEENKDFLEYIRLIRQFYQTGDLREIDWDKGIE